MANNYLKAVIFISLFMIAEIAFATGPPPPKPIVPIDGGLFVLFAAGILYGINKLRNKNK